MKNNGNSSEASVGKYKNRIAVWMNNDTLEAEKKPILTALKEYGADLERELPPTPLLMNHHEETHCDPCIPDGFSIVLKIKKILKKKVRYVRF